MKAIIEFCCVSIIIIILIFALLDLLKGPQRVRVIHDQPERVKLVQRCKHCGTLNDEKNLYCSYCGKRL